MKIRTLALAGLMLAAGITARHAWSSSGDEVVAPTRPPARTGALPALAARTIEVAREPPRQAAIELSDLGDSGDPESDSESDSDEARDADLEELAELIASATDGHGALHGRIVDVDGVPVAGVRITLDSRDGTAPALTAYTDEHGLYQVPYIPHGARVLMVDKQGLGFVPQALTITASEVSELDVQPDPSNVQRVIKIPTGRTFEAVLGAAAGSQVDSHGMSIVAAAEFLEEIDVGRADY
jgi:hypothetical protein